MCVHVCVRARAVSFWANFYLSSVVLQGNARFLKLLLSRRANWLQKDLEEMTPLHLATRHPSPKALALLLKHIGPGEVDTQDKNKVLQLRTTQTSCVKLPSEPSGSSSETSQSGRLTNNSPRDNRLTD